MATKAKMLRGAQIIQDKGGSVKLRQQGGKMISLARGVSFLGKFTRSVVPEIGPLPYWASNASATARGTVIDAYGILRVKQFGEFGFFGLRRVENLLRFSNAFDNEAWVSSGAGLTVSGVTDADVVGADSRTCYMLTGNGTDSLFNSVTTGTLSATRHIFSIDLRAGTAGTAVISLYVSGGATVQQATVTLTAGWNRFAVQGPCDGTSAYRVLVRPAVAGTIYARDAQLENAAGLPLDGSGNAPPSEYVSRDAIAYAANGPAPYHGAGVDGVSYFDTYNGNNVANVGKLVTLALGEPIPDATLHGLTLNPQISNLITDGRSLSAWSINGTSLTRTANSSAGPTGETVATLLTEDNANTAKWLSRDLATIADNQRITVTACVRKPSSNGLDFVYLAVRRRDGVVVLAHFSLVAGTIPAGQATTGNAERVMRAIGGGWYFVALTVSVGAGATTVHTRVGLATANGETTYTGLGTRGVLVDFVNAYLKEGPTVPILPQEVDGSNGILSGHAVTCRLGDVNAVLGTNDWSFYGECRPWFRTGMTGKTSDGTTTEWYYPFYFRALPPNQQYSRLGMTIRPGYDAAAGFAVCTLDRYLGNTVPALKWRPNTPYQVGAFVVPADTALDNTNLRKQYTCVQAGVSGSVEPTWNTTFTSPPDVVSNLTVDNTVRWQANHDNRIQAQYENYDGALKVTDYAPFTNMRVAFWLRANPADFLGAINGALFERQTAPFPCDLSSRGDLRYPVDELRLGRAASAYPTCTASYRNICIWADDETDPDYYRELTAA